MTTWQRLAFMWVATLANVAILAVTADHHHAMYGGVLVGVTCAFVGMAVWR